VESFHHGRKGIAARHLLKACSIQSVKAKIDRSDAKAFEVFNERCSKDAVGSDANFFNAFNGAKAFEKRNQVVAHEGFAAGDAQFGDAKRGKEFSQSQKLFKREYIVMRKKINAFSGHAVETAQIAAVGN
jgi:hypothetical protein